MGIRKVLTAAALAVALLAPGAANALEVAGVQVPTQVRLGAGGPELVLNGAGIRTRLMFKVYVGALYLGTRSSDANLVLADRGPKRVALHMLRDVPSESLAKLLLEGLAKNHGQSELVALQPKTAELLRILTAEPEVKAGSVLALDYLPGIGMRIGGNGREMGVIPGDDLYPALLRVWLGERPVDEDLKDAMLGRTR